MFFTQCIAATCSRCSRPHRRSRAPRPAHHLSPSPRDVTSPQVRASLLGSQGPTPTTMRNQSGRYCCCTQHWTALAQLFTAPVTEPLHIALAVADSYILAVSVPTKEDQKERHKISLKYVSCDKTSSIVSLMILARL